MNIMDKTLVALVATVIVFLTVMMFNKMYIVPVHAHNEKIEFMTACGNLEAEINQDHCTIMWYSRGAAH